MALLTKEQIIEVSKKMSSMTIKQFRKKNRYDTKHT